MNGIGWCQGQRDGQLERELFGGMNSGINFDKYDDIPIEVKGKNVPPIISNFNDLNLHPWLMDNINLSRYTKPTPVQKAAVPTAMMGRDLMACAQTGSGKTGAFLFPIIHDILNRGPSAVRPKEIRNGYTCQFPTALIMAPTRELSMQIYQEACKFTYRMPISVAVLYGGQENRREQVDKLRALRTCSILVATPGRLMDIMEHGNVNLSNCRYLILDEADRMLDMGFEPQIRKIVDKSTLPKLGQRRTMLFSATFPSAIQQLARDFLVADYIFLAVGRVGSTSENIKQNIELIPEHQKKVRVMDLLDQNRQGLTLIFTETKRAAADLTRYLYNQAYDTVAIHGDMTQSERERNLAAFRCGQKPILVATNVAARGLDIPNVTHVINYDLPGDIDDYVHRIGRTGRVGNIGLATSFYNDKNCNIARPLIKLIQEAKQVVPDFLLRSTVGGGSGGGSYSSFSSNSSRSYSSPNFASSNNNYRSSNFGSSFNSGSFNNGGFNSGGGGGGGIREVTGKLGSLFGGMK